LVLGKRDSGGNACLILGYWKVWSSEGIGKAFEREFFNRHA